MAYATILAEFASFFMQIHVVDSFSGLLEIRFATVFDDDDDEPRQGRGQGPGQGHGQDQKWRQRSALQQQMVLALTLVLALVRNIIIFSRVRVLVLNQPTFF